MNISYQWLKELVPFEYDVRQLADKLTFAGIEVEAVEELGGGDWRLELEVTPNRPDCLSLLGIAREIRALAGGTITIPDITVKDAGSKVNSLATVVVEDKEGCPRYVARVVTGIKVSESPDWLKKKIESVGLRPINNVADVTNLVLYEFGHPLHAFDLAKMAGRGVVVRRARAGEAIITIDGVERKLTAEHLVIADSAKPAALAGIMGGAATEISAGTTEVLLESAYFDPGLIRRGSRSLGLKSDASYRFERGADPLALERAVDRAAKLIAELAGGTVAEGRIDVSTKKFPASWELTLEPAKADRLLGIRIPADRMVRILNDLEIKARLEGQLIKAAVPSFRGDLAREVDLIEEVARIHGYDQLPDDRAAGWNIPARARSRDAGIKRMAQAMVSQGFFEHYGLPMADPAALEKLFPGAPDKGQAVKLANPLSSELSVLRPLLLPGLLQALIHNLNNGQADVRLFEIGLAFIQTKDGSKPQERLQLAAIATGASQGGWWGRKPQPYDFFDIKGAAESLFAAVGLDDVRFEPGAGGRSYLYQERSATLAIAGAEAGAVGELDPAVSKAFDIKERAYCLELWLDPVLGPMAEKQPRYRELPRQQVLKRDLAIAVDAAVDWGTALDLIRQAGGQELERAELFDLYQGDQLGPGKKGLAFSLRYRMAQGSITEEQAGRAHQRIVDILRNKIHADIR